MALIIPLILPFILLKSLVLSEDDIYQSGPEEAETTSVTGTIFNLTTSQLNECVILVNWKFATYPLSDGSYTLRNMLPGKYIITISHPKLKFHDVFLVITKIHGAFRILASRYSPHFGREGKSWDRIAHQPIGLHVDESANNFISIFKKNLTSFPGLILLFLAIYSVLHTPRIVARRRLYALLYNLEWLSKKTGHGWNKVSKIVKQYFDQQPANPNPNYEESNKIDWGTVNKMESYRDDMITPFISEILNIVRSSNT